MDHPMGQPVIRFLLRLLRRLSLLSNKSFRLISFLWSALQNLFTRPFGRTVTPPSPKRNLRNTKIQGSKIDTCERRITTATCTTKPTIKHNELVTITSSRVPSIYSPNILQSGTPRAESPVSQSGYAFQRNNASSHSAGSIQVDIEPPDASEWASTEFYDDVTESGWHPRNRNSPRSEQGSGGGRSVRSVAPNRTAIPGLGNEPSIIRAGKGPIAPLLNPKLKPGVPEAYNRYGRNIIIPKIRTDYTIDALTTNFLDNRADPSGWLSYVHPEGALYFFHMEKRVFTDANLFDPNVREQVEDRLHIIYTHMEEQGISIAKIGKNVDLVLDMLPVKGSKEPECYYYFADHATRTIFYLQPVQASHMPGWDTVEGVQSFQHVRHEVEAQFWYHCLLFPRSFELDHDILEQFRDVVLFFISDLMSSPTSTSPFNIVELQQVLRMINNLQKNLGTQYGGCAAAIGRIMNMFARHRFHHFHGEPGARLDSQQSVHGYKFGKRQWLVKYFSPVLFSAPDVHLRTLEKIWVDGVMHQPSWQKFVDKLTNEWTEIVLYATVVLNANVAFLAIQSIDTDPDQPSYRSPAQISSYVSTIISMGCIIIGLVLTRQKRIKIKVTVDDVIAFLLRRRLATLGLEHLAIMYSLPYALLMWSMVFFVLSFLFVFFMGTTSETRGILGCACVAIAVLTIWSIWMGWEPPAHHGGDDDDDCPDEGQKDNTSSSIDEKSLPLASDGQTSDNVGPGSTTAAVGSTNTYSLGLGKIREKIRSIRLPWTRAPVAATPPMREVDNRV